MLPQQQRRPGLIRPLPWPQHGSKIPGEHVVQKPHMTTGARAIRDDTLSHLVIVERACCSHAMATADTRKNHATMMMDHLRCSHMSIVSRPSSNRTNRALISRWYL